jgi:hypothetical protein
MRVGCRRTGRRSRRGSATKNRDARRTINQSGDLPVRLPERYWRRPSAPGSVRANKLIRCFCSAQTCSIRVPMADLVVFALKMRTGIGRRAALLAVDVAHQHEMAWIRSHWLRIN